MLQSHTKTKACSPAIYEVPGSCCPCDRAISEQVLEVEVIVQASVMVEVEVIVQVVEKVQQGVIVHAAHEDVVKVIRVDKEETSRDGVS